MTIKTKAAVAATILALTVGSSSAVFAKAHDQGVADGSAPESTSGTVQSIPGPGVSALVNNGQRGAGASANGGDNRVVPVVGNGANQPD